MARPEHHSRAERAARFLGLEALYFAFILSSFAGVIALCVLTWYLAPPSRDATVGTFVKRMDGPIARGLTPYNRTQKPNFAFNHHAHTTASDGRMTPDMLIRWHIANGYDGFAVTDHNTMDAVEETKRLAKTVYNDSIVVLGGYEWTTGRGHFNFVGISTIPAAAVSSSWLSCPTDEQIQSAVDDVHAQGGVVSVNHYPWSWGARLSTPDLAAVLSFGIDYAEVASGWGVDVQTLLWVTDSDHPLGQIAGADVHRPAFAANAWTTLSVANRSAEAVMEELRARRASWIYSDLVEGTYTNYESPIKPLYKFLSPLIDIGSWMMGFFPEVSTGSTASDGALYCVSGATSSSQSSAKVTSASGKTKYSVDWKKLFALIFWVFCTFVAGEVIKHSAVALFQKAKAVVASRRRAKYAFVAPVDEFEWSAGPIQLLENTDNADQQN